MRRRLIGLAVGALFLLAGCATATSRMEMGVLPQGERLVTLVVSEDRDIVRRACAHIPVVGRALGCQQWRQVTLPGVGDVRLITIVRYTDVMPSALALEIDAHELCHAIAALQPIADPCHADNGGVIRSASDTHVRWR
jgi:hypothetical protein